MAERTTNTVTEFMLEEDVIYEPCSHCDEEGGYWLNDKWIVCVECDGKRFVEHECESNI
jgi:hypothetical protein